MIPDTIDFKTKSEEKGKVHVESRTIKNVYALNTKALDFKNKLLTIKCFKRSTTDDNLVIYFPCSHT